MLFTLDCKLSCAISVKFSSFRQDHEIMMTPVGTSGTRWITDHKRVKTQGKNSTLFHQNLHLPAESPVLIQSGLAMLAMAKMSAARKRHPEITVSLSITTTSTCTGQAASPPWDLSCSLQVVPPLISVASPAGFTQVCCFSGRIHACSPLISCFCTDVPLLSPHTQPLVFPLDAHRRKTPPMFTSNQCLSAISQHFLARRKLCFLQRAMLPSLSKAQTQNSSP